MDKKKCKTSGSLVLGCILVAVVAGLAIVKGFDNVTAAPNPYWIGAVCLILSYVIHKMTEDAWP